MGPYRSNRSGNRPTRTTQIDHDVFEGLPVRHWRKKPMNVSVPQEQAKSSAISQNAYPELPLPRDFSILPETSQALLRAARLGLKKDHDSIPELKRNETSFDDEPSFIANRWSLVPRELEGPETEYLAKRRKGLPSTYNGGTDALDGTEEMRKTKIRKQDANGASHVWEVLVPIGQKIDGEIAEDEATPVKPPAPGTHVEGLGVVNEDGLVVAGSKATPTGGRKKPPIPQKKKKKHGPGRGIKTMKDGADDVGTNGVALESDALRSEGQLEINEFGEPAQRLDDGEEDESDEASENDESADILEQRLSTSQEKPTGEGTNNDSSGPETEPDGDGGPNPNLQVFAIGDGQIDVSTAVAGPDQNGTSNDLSFGHPDIEGDKAMVTEMRTLGKDNLDYDDGIIPSKRDLESGIQQSGQKSVEPLAFGYTAHVTGTNAPNIGERDIQMTSSNLEKDNLVTQEVVQATVSAALSPPPIKETLSKFPEPPRSIDQDLLESHDPKQKALIGDQDSDPLSTRQADHASRLSTPQRILDPLREHKPTESPKAPTMSPPTPVDGPQDDLQGEEPPSITLDTKSQAPLTSTNGLSKADSITKVEVESEEPVKAALLNAEASRHRDPGEAPIPAPASAPGGSIPGSSKTQVRITKSTYIADGSETRKDFGSGGSDPPNDERVRFEDGSEDLLGSLEKNLEKSEKAA